MGDGTAIGRGILGGLLLGLLVGAPPAWGQGRTTGGRLTDLEQRVDEMLRLNEAFLPTVEQLATRLETLERQVAQLPSSVAAYDARRDVAELRNRIATLEAAARQAARRNSTHDFNREFDRSYTQVAPLRTERDLLAARIDGTEARIETLAERASGGEFRPRHVGGFAAPVWRPIVESPAAAGKRRYTIVIQVFEE